MITVKRQLIRAIVVAGLLSITAQFPLTGYAAAGKVALVIGVGEYMHAPRLPNPPNDAALVGRTLESMGFDVAIELNLNRGEFEDALSKFAEKSKRADISLIYYAGHGIQVAGKVYLIPADGRVSTGRDLRRLIDTEYLLEDAALAKRLSVVILDACRDSPFTRSLAEDLGPSRSSVLGRGLSRIDEVPRNTLIAYATSAGDIALDGDGANSPFALALAENLRTPGRDVRIAFGAVRDKVLELTNHRQEPFIYGSLGGSVISLAGGETTVAPKQLPVDPSPNVTDLLAISNDYASWLNVVRNGSWSYLSRFHTLFADSYYSILAAQLLDARRKNPSLNFDSAITGLNKHPFEPRTFSRRQTIEIQRRLAAAGFYGGSIDGVWAKQSEQALGAFAELHGHSKPNRYSTLRRLGEYADSQDVTGHLSGRWSGRYFYRRPVNGVTNVPFEMDLVVSQSRINGSIIEPNTFGDSSSRNLYADFKGRIIGNQVTWRKRYDGTGGVDHDVLYSGIIDRSANRIAGRWDTGKSTGNFRMELVR